MRTLTVFTAVAASAGAAATSARAAAETTAVAAATTLVRCRRIPMKTPLISIAGDRRRNPRRLGQTSVLAHRTLPLCQDPDVPRGPRRHLASIVAATAVVVAIATVVPGPPAATNLGAEPAHAMVMADAPPAATVRIDPSASLRGYATPAVTLAKGGTLSVVNFDSARHSVTSDDHDASGTALFSAIVDPGGTATVDGVSLLAPGTYPFHCIFHAATMRGTLTISGAAAACSLPRFVRPALDASPDVAHREDEDPDQAGRGAGLPDRAADDDVDLRRHLPGSHHRAPGRQGHEGHLRQPAAVEAPACPCTCTGTTTRPRPTGNRRGTSSPRGRRGPTTTRWSTAAGRSAPPLLVPRPPDGRDHPQQLARPAGHVPRHGRQEREAGAALRRLRRATDGVRAQLRRQQPAGAGDAARDDDDRTDGATGRQHGGRPHPGQRPLRAVPRRGHAPVPAPAAQHLALHDVRLRALRRAPVRAGRHRQRSAAQGSGAPGHPARAGPAGGRRGGLPQRARQGRRPPERPAHERTCRSGRLAVGADHAVPGRGTR